MGIADLFRKKEEDNPSGVFIVGPDYDSSYEKLFELYGWESVSNIDDTDLMLFTGGVDVHPREYGEKEHPKTNAVPTRDTIDKIYYLIAKSRCIPMVGVCRGGQFLNVMEGGSLWQHVDGHLGAHQVTSTTSDGKEVTFQVTSTHHQMMTVGAEGTKVGWADCSTVRESISPGDGKLIQHKGENQKDAEIVPYKNILCYQPHPEFHPESDCAAMFFYYIHAHLMNEKINCEMKEGELCVDL